MTPETTHASPFPQLPVEIERYVFTLRVSELSRKVVSYMKAKVSVLPDPPCGTQSLADPKKNPRRECLTAASFETFI